MNPIDYIESVKPHHIHNGENEVAPGVPVNIFIILDEIAKITAE